MLVGIDWTTHALQEDEDEDEEEEETLGRKILNKRKRINDDMIMYLDFILNYMNLWPVISLIHST